MQPLYNQIFIESVSDPRANTKIEKCALLSSPLHEMVISSMDLVLPPGPGGVGHAGAESRRELAHEVVIQAVLERTQDDHRTGELEVDLLR